MLILVAGVTGYLGNLLTEYGLEKGHQIRGFGRSPSKLPASILNKLESFVQCQYYDDKAALDKAGSGVDAVVCAYAPTMTAVMESQICLLRTVERAGVKVYHAHSWNCDWSKLSLGYFEFYDCYIMFRRYIELTSSIKPVYVFTGAFGEMVLGEHVGIGYLKDTPDGKVFNHWGAGDAKYNFTYMPDAARFSIDLITTDSSVLAGNGGLFSIQSGEASAKDISKVYEKIKGEKVRLRSLGGLEDLKVKLKEARATLPPSKWFAYTNHISQIAAIEKAWTLDDPKVVGAVDAVGRLFDTQIDRTAEFLE
ncbi:hypothetical protein JX266_008831 [Neoarthrinium moseri]|nr:hypothetical protein JX266_008831 [Neoarthrinium moseri]